MRYPRQFVMRRLLLLLLIVWSAATLNFFIPKLTPRNPLREKLLAEAVRTGYIPPGFEEMVAAYEQKFGLDKPVFQQYLTYMGDLLRGDLGYSISLFPKTVAQLIGEALPWTIGLLTVTTILAFLIGTLLGALMGWERSSAFFRYIMPSFLVLGAIPAFVLGLIVQYFLAFRWKLLPLSGGYPTGTLPNLSVDFVLAVLRHSILPAFAVILATTGGWAIGMRGMMVTVQGEDYMNFAEAKGLKDRRMFFRYGVRNAMLPQVTGLALAFSGIVTGSVLVEIIFNYPGIGTLLVQSIRTLDYFVIYGIVLVLIITIAIAMFIMDMIYPLLDPRIRYGQD